MKLSKSKPNLRHKKILSASINQLRNSITKNEFKENIQNNIDKKEQLQTINNNNNDHINDNDKDTELINSTQSDWVKSAIEITTKNNKILKLSLDNDNCLKQEKIKVNKIQKFKEYDIKEKKEYNNEELERESKISINDDNLNDFNKIDNKGSFNIMISTKDSEKIKKNFKYLSNRKDYNEIIFPENFNNIYDYRANNNEEDIVNMKTLTYFNIETELSSNDKKYNINRIYKRRIKTGYLYSQNNSKQINKSKVLENRNNNNLFSNIKFYTNANEVKGFKTQLFSSNIKNKMILQDNISFKNKNNEKNYINTFDNNNLENLSIYNKNDINNSKKYITSYINSKKNLKIKNKKININQFEINKGPTFSTNISKEKSEEKSIKNNKLNIFNNNGRINHQFITPTKNINSKSQNFYPISKFMKKNVSYGNFSSSTIKSNILLKNFLMQINMQKYYTILKMNGFDNINLLIEQMRTNIPIKDSELKNAGIDIPGDRAKILIRLEEKGNLFPFPIPKNVYYCLEDNTDIHRDNNIINLKRWLNEFKMENYLNNFIKNGYHSVELFLFQMISKNPIDNDILQYEIGIEKIGHRSRILSILKEESKNIQERLEKKECINITDETKNCGCYII